MAVWLRRSGDGGLREQLAKLVPTLIRLIIIGGGGVAWRCVTSDNRERVRAVRGRFMTTTARTTMMMMTMTANMMMR